MTRTKQLALAFYLGAALAGAAIGVTVDRWVLRDRLVPRWWDQRAMRVRLADELKLDSTQRVALDTILDDRNRRYEAVMGPVRPQLDTISDATRQRIRTLLTPEQLAIYEQMQRERENARRTERR